LWLSDKKSYSENEKQPTEKGAFSAGIEDAFSSGQAAGYRRCAFS
jgi:hypothetical protein